MKQKKFSFRALHWMVAGALLVPSMVQAFDVPRHAFSFDRLEEAQKEAFTDKSPVLLLLADPKKEPT